MSALKIVLCEFYFIKVRIIFTALLINAKEEIIKEYIYSSLKKLDSNNILKKEDINIEFDTKENFDTNYESNWYYYIL